VTCTERIRKRLGPRQTKHAIAPSGMAAWMIFIRLVLSIMIRPIVLHYLPAMPAAAFGTDRRGGPLRECPSDPGYFSNFSGETL